MGLCRMLPHKFFVSVISTICLILLSGCFDTLTEQDQQFAKKIKERLKEIGDTAKVADIHPGDWEKLCYTDTWGNSYGDVLDDTKRSLGVEGRHLTLLNSGGNNTLIWRHWKLDYIFLLSAG